MLYLVGWKEDKGREAKRERMMVVVVVEVAVLAGVVVGGSGWFWCRWGLRVW